MRFYSPSNNAFYLAGLHKQMPDDKVALSDEEYAFLLSEQANGKIIYATEAGQPIIRDAPPSKYHKWNGSSYTIDTSKKQELISEYRQTVRQYYAALAEEPITLEDDTVLKDHLFAVAGGGRADIMDAAVGAKTGVDGMFPIPWVTVAGDVVSVAQEQAIALAEAVGIRRIQMQSTVVAIFANIQDKTTAEILEEFQAFPPTDGE